MILRRSSLPLATALGAMLASALAFAEARPAQVSNDPFWTAVIDMSAGGMAVGDANGDGIPDLAIGTYAGGYPETALNDYVFAGNAITGLGTSPIWTSNDTSFTTDALWAFVTGAASPDLIMVNGGGSTSPAMLYAPGTSGLPLDPTSTHTPENGSGLVGVAGDVNGDGIADLFVANQCYLPCEEVIAVGYVSENGALPAASNWKTSILSQWAGAALADLDRGAVERATITRDGDGQRRLFWIPGAPLHELVRVLVDRGNPGKITYDLKAGWVLFATAPAAGTTVELTYERSSQPDLALSSNPGPLAVFANNGQGIDKTATWTGNPPGEGYKAIVFVDLDRDGYPELFAAGGSGSPAVVFKNVAGVLEAVPSWVSDNQDFGIEDATVLDANGDGWLDVLVATFNYGYAIFLNQHGVLETNPSVAFTPADKSIASCEAFDANSDGMPDVVLGFAGEKPQIFLNQTLPMPAPTITTQLPADFDPAHVTALPIDGTGFEAPVRVFLGDVEATSVVVQSSTHLVATFASPATASELVVVNSDLQAATAKPMPPGDTDGGVPGNDAGQPTVDAGQTQGTDGGIAQNPGTAEESGCGCSTGSVAGNLWGLLALSIALVERRRRLSRG
jgi:MYXO-CTERM domain-containing protein